MVMADRDKKHILVPRLPNTEAFMSVQAGGAAPREIFIGDRRAHGLALKAALQQALESDTTRSDAEDESAGTYVTFESFPELALALGSLDSRRRNGKSPELVSSSRFQSDAGEIEMATVFIPDGGKSHFLRRLDEYVATSSSDKTRHAALIDAIRSVRRTTIRELWTDAPQDFPSTSTRVWWEVWLRKRDGGALHRLRRYVDKTRLRMSEHTLGFGERTVALVWATVDELSLAFESLDDFAELRRPADVASVLVGMQAFEQQGWVEELLARTHVAAEDAPAICILDTGVQREHPLLRGSLSESDTHAVEPSWSKEDRHGHGTEMAGLALFSDLFSAILCGRAVVLLHRLESVKLLDGRDGGKDDDSKDLYAAITARAVDRVEIQRPSRSRVFLVATTAPRYRAGNQEPEVGRPSSWSAAIDALAVGRSIDDSDTSFTYLDPDVDAGSRVFVLAAGNIRDLDASIDYLDRCDLEPIEDPGQAWNAITVGAYTELDKIDDDGFEGYVPVSSRGELSPSSRTSVVFNSEKWPIKPDVVAEGGNYAIAPDGRTVDSPDSLAVLTSRRMMPGRGPLTTTRDTSAATAQVAAIAADIMAEYPDFWAETVRGLVVHSARWSEPMIARFRKSPTRAFRAKLLRRYGMGIPDGARALRSASDALTLISQATIRPFQHAKGKGNDGTFRDMNLHSLPWPTEVLEELGSSQVQMRVTLSYFIEPNPSSRGWGQRYQYPSYGLRFDVRRPSESTEDFRKRINVYARSESDNIHGSDSDSKQWFFGAKNRRSPGSIHTDVWSGTAIELARRGVIAVFPVSGWWKLNKDRDRSDAGVKYSLIVSIETPEVEVDLWTPVYQQVMTELAVTV